MAADSESVMRQIITMIQQKASMEDNGATFNLCMVNQKGAFVCLCGCVGGGGISQHQGFCSRGKFQLSGINDDLSLSS